MKMASPKLTNCARGMWRRTSVAICVAARSGERKRQNLPVRGATFISVWASQYVQRNAQPRDMMYVNIPWRAE